MGNLMAIKSLHPPTPKAMLRYTITLALVASLSACTNLTKNDSIPNSGAGTSTLPQSSSQTSPRTINNSAVTSNTTGPINNQLKEQRAAIDNIRSEIININDKRYKIKQEIFEIRLKEGLSNKNISDLQKDLDNVNQQYSSLNNKLTQLSNETDSNSNAIAKLERQEEYRKEVIIQLNQNWQKINKESDKILIELEKGDSDERQITE